MGMYVFVKKFVLVFMIVRECVINLNVRNRDIKVFFFVLYLNYLDICKKCVMEEYLVYIF